MSGVITRVPAVEIFSFSSARFKEYSAAVLQNDKGYLSILTSQALMRARNSGLCSFFQN